MRTENPGAGLSWEETDHAYRRRGRLESSVYCYRLDRHVPPDSVECSEFEGVAVLTLSQMVVGVVRFGRVGALAASALLAACFAESRLSRTALSGARAGA